MGRLLWLGRGACGLGRRTEYSFPIHPMGAQSSPARCRHGVRRRSGARDGDTPVLNSAGCETGSVHQGGEPCCATCELLTAPIFLERWRSATPDASGRVPLVFGWNERLG